MSKFLWTVSSYSEPLPTLYIRTQKVNVYRNMQIKHADFQPLTKIAHLLLQLFLVSSRIYQNNFCTFAQLKTGQKPTNDQTMQTLINIKEVTVKTTESRRYGKSFFSYGEVTYKDKTINCGDPFQSSKFPFIEGLLTLVMKTEGEKQLSEKDFRQCFKGMKNGAEQYSKLAAFLEDNHNVNFI